MIKPLTLEGLSVSLVPLSLAHLDRLCAIGLDPQLWQATTIKVSNRDQMVTYVAVALEMQANGTGLPFVISEHTTKEIVGMTRYHSAMPEQGRIEIGFSWVCRPWQRTVVNTESKYLLLRHAFDKLGYSRVQFRANSENEQSCRALLRIGAKHEAILSCDRIAPSGTAFDMAMFSIIATEWPQVRSALEARLNGTVGSSA